MKITKKMKQGYSYDEVKLLETAEKKRLEGSTLDAINLYLKLTILKPDAPYAFVRLAVFYDDMKEYDKALENYDKAIDLKPDSPKTIMARAELKEEIGDLNGAIADYEFYLKKWPFDTNCLIAIGMIYEYLKLKENALYYYKKALQVDKENKEAKYRLSEITKNCIHRK